MRVRSPLPTSKRHLLAFGSLIGIGIGVLAQSVEAKESLLEKSQVRPLTPAERTAFGPQSGQFSYDQRMIKAAAIALKRAERQKTWHCWRYVKDALLAANLIATRPTSPWAKQAGDELCGKFGFTKLNLHDPSKAPVGAVIVYGGPDAGHVELRTATGYVSDFISATPYPRPLVGIFVKL